MPLDVGDNDRETAEDESEDLGSKKIRPNQPVEIRDTRRQAALRNTLCPPPDAESGPALHVHAPSRVKKGSVGRGRSTQAAARTEKGQNMKPLAHFGLQERFKAPAVVTDAGKGRGRGGKHPKRKRDVPSL
ncbi:hypothetical protein KC19_N021100 [Ceratodon purpureus]|nr:hypothetical protein KC19_N021100 [Ceratodon purpureus]